MPSPGTGAQLAAADRDQRLGADQRAREAERGQLAQEQHVPAQRSALKALVAGVAVEQHQAEGVFEQHLRELERGGGRDRGFAGCQGALEAGVW